jgi:glycosyltransferase involved in cell wall biosynthesis
MGAYAYDSKLFKNELSSARQKQFAFIGRKISEKGLDTLLSSYEIYRIMCHENEITPWELVLAGPGELKRSVAGTSEYGYLTPSDTSALMMRSTCLILPSKAEPYGVVLLEAAAVGSLIIATDRVGAIEQTIQEGINGYVVPSNSPRLMAEAMLKTTQLDSQQLESGHNESIQRAKFFTPEAWAKRVLEMQSIHRS